MIDYGTDDADVIKRLERIVEQAKKWDIERMATAIPLALDGGLR